jgi:hypothetical protein
MLTKIILRSAHYCEWYYGQKVTVGLMIHRISQDTD